MSQDRDHFGFQVVSKSEKQDKVQKVFSDVADQYDLMNDLMSFGLHRVWKRRFISDMALSGNDILLDIAGGTGDIAERFVRRGGGKAIICDLNEAMLKQGERHRIDRGLLDLPLQYVLANAESLPFDDNSFDFCTIAFGIRNVTNISKALSEARRVLKLGGKFLCLEFSHVDSSILAKLYNFYSFQIIPKIGQYVAGSADHYRYLSESIKLFPRAAKFASIMEEAGFELVSYYKLSFGVVAVHSGYKIHL